MGWLLMNRIEILENAIKIIDISQKITKILAKPWMDAYNPPDEEEQSIVNAHWQEISRIAAEQAAKPEIQGYSEHG
jgi:hypothetical protein